MALRVLLADESSTIKKVMQLALADFAVDVKSVPVGLDVLSTAKSFKPDIIFADVLLTKKTGYEVCADLKTDSETAHIPVVLMWSSFMEVDEHKVQDCQADRRLEKPFDAEHLRSLVKELVQKTQSNPISSFLSFPEMPEFEETPVQEDVYNISEIDSDNQMIPIPEITGFSEINALPEISDIPEIDAPSQEEFDEGGWAHQDLSKFKLNLPDPENAGDFASKFVIPQDEDLENAKVQVEGDFEEISFAKKDTTAGRAATTKAAVKNQMLETLQKKKSTESKDSSNAEPYAQSKIDINVDLVEKIIREEAREVIESVCWKLLPEIAERIVREEINKILKETEI